MESRLKNDSLKEYANKFASSIAGKFFDSREKITGAEILKLSEIKQVNMFVLMELFQSWEHELDQMKSPYFNYDHPDVVEAMKKFHNTLSNHIEIGKEDFNPLFLEAIEKTLNIIFSPYHFYVQAFSRVSRITREELGKLMKYIKINAHLLDSLIKRMEENREYQSDELVKLFDEVCGESLEIPEDFDSYLQQFSEVESLTLDMIYEEEEEENESESGSVSVSVSASESDDNEETSDETEASEKKGGTLNDKYNKEGKTLNDQIKAKLDSTLAEIHQTKKIESLVKSISVNQRYQFTKELFAGNRGDMENTISTMDEMDALENAVAYAEEIAQKNSWDMDSEEAIEFMLLIRRRFES